MRRAILIAVYTSATLLMGCDQGSDLSDADVEDFFQQHTVEGNHAVAMKKRSLGTTAYLATIHGYPNNLSVCEQVIAPFNEGASLSDVPGEYFCEELR
jgi:hypothetical protein